ncbi:MAG: hypothetical protein RL490_295 [Pseudomonadota bacterium]|jgi:hypothetical protein
MPITDIIDIQVEAYNRGDTAAFVATYADDAICSRIPSGVVMAAGRAQIADVWGAMFVRSPRTCVVRNRMVQDDFVIDHERVTLHATGTVIDALAIYRVHDGLIAQVWFPDVAA